MGQQGVDCTIGHTLTDCKGLAAQRPLDVQSDWRSEKDSSVREFKDYALAKKINKKAA